MADMGMEQGESSVSITLSVNDYPELKNVQPGASVRVAEVANGSVTLEIDTENRADKDLKTMRQNTNGMMEGGQSPMGMDVEDM